MGDANDNKQLADLTIAMRVSGAYPGRSVDIRAAAEAAIVPAVAKKPAANSRGMKKSALDDDGGLLQ